MKDKQLLSVVFSDADQFRERLLRETLTHVRRKRRMRQCAQALIAAMVAAIAILPNLPRRTADSPPAAAAAGVQFVQTRALSAEQVATTRQGSVSIITSDRLTVALLEDEQLLDVIPAKTKLLVWHAPHEAELVIIGP